MRSLIARSLFVVAMTAAMLIPAQAALAFNDVPRNYWDCNQIMYVSVSHPWMRDYGLKFFHPTWRENRSFLARSLVTMFAPNEPIDPRIRFSDLPGNDPFYRYANVAVKLGWITRYSNNRWSGASAVPRSLFDQAITMAMGLKDPIYGLAHIHEDDGSPYVVDGRWPHMQLATYLRLHYNHADESKDLEANTLMTRDEVAYSLWMSQVVPQYLIAATARFDTISLPALDPRNPGQNVQHQLTQYAMNQVGFPYIWGGEWNAQSPPGYCCGYQPQGGFDCSGFVWWVLKKYEDGYNSAQYRVYPGWSVHERTTYEMARWTPQHIAFANLQIGNLILFASNGGKRWQDADHVGIYIGNGWMIHSTSGGPQIEWLQDGWYHDHFLWGRGLTTNSRPHFASRFDLLDGDPAVGGPPSPLGASG